MGEIVAQNM